MRNAYSGTMRYNQILNPQHVTSLSVDFSSPDSLELIGFLAWGDMKLGLYLIHNFKDLSITSNYIILRVYQ